MIAAAMGLFFYSEAYAQHRPPPDDNVSGAITGSDPVAAESTAIGVATHSSERETKSTTESQATGLTTPYPGASEPKGDYYKGKAERSGDYYQGGAQVNETYKAPSIESPEQ